jgi:hypothetical protein
LATRLADRLVGSINDVGGKNMKKIIPILSALIVLILLLSACDLLGGSTAPTPVSDEQMATRVAELLSTMTTPTTEIVFPPTPTPTLTVEVLPTLEVTETTATPQQAVTQIITTTPDPNTTVTVAATVEATEETGGEDDATPTPTATATASANDPANSLGNPTSSDSLDSRDKWAWPTGEDDYVKVSFADGKMLMTGLTNYAGWRLPSAAQQTDTYIELTANSGSCSGKDSYGIIFRVPVLKDPTQGYLYEVTCDGYYRLWKWDGEVSPNGLATVLVSWGQSSLINAGADQTNRLGVMVKDHTFTLYMNGEKIASATDSAYEAGFFGVFVRSVETDDYTVKFDALRFWELP